MLGKLIKYDLKATSRFLIVIHAFLLLIAVFLRIIFIERLANSSYDGSELGITLVFTVFFVGFIGASFGTYLIIATRFYKNLFSDEGYLTHTLPVKRGTHLLTKTISGTIWGMIDVVLLYLSIYILISCRPLMEVFSTHGAEIAETFGFASVADAKMLLIYFVVFSLLSTISSVVMIYASVVFGQLFGGHQVLGAVVAYFVLQTVIGLLSTAFMGVQGMIYSYNTAADELSTFADWMWSILNMSLAMEAVVTIILYVASYLLMKKKLNLN